jgi:hypothetical protein
VALIGTYESFIRTEGITLLVVGLYDLLKIGEAEVGMVGVSDPADQVSDVCPSVFVKCDPDDLRAVSEDHGYKFSE